MVLEGRYRKGGNRGGQQSPQRQGGHHSDQATAHLQVPVNKILTIGEWNEYLLKMWEGGRETKQCSKEN